MADDCMAGSFLKDGLCFYQSTAFTVALARAYTGHLSPSSRPVSRRRLGCDAIKLGKMLLSSALTGESGACTGAVDKCAVVNARRPGATLADRCGEADMKPCRCACATRRKRTRINERRTEARLDACEDAASHRSV